MRPNIRLNMRPHYTIGSRRNKAILTVFTRKSMATGYMPPHHRRTDTCRRNLPRQAASEREDRKGTQPLQSWAQQS
jgi:hypothetical protein